jgi:hypothetical protein
MYRQLMLKAAEEGLPVQEIMFRGGHKKQGALLLA